MCQITSLFLEAERMLSGNARNFSNMKTRAVIKFFFFSCKAKTPEEIHAIVTETLGEHAPLYATVENWVVRLKHVD